MFYEDIKQLVEYGIESGLTPECERIYTRNLLLDLFKEDSYEDVEIKEKKPLAEILNSLVDYGVEKGLVEDSITNRDLFDTRIMNALMPRPKTVIDRFWCEYNKAPKEATKYFYKLSCDSNYIRRDRIAKDKKWKVDSPYGEIDITINLSKPEKDPKAIAAAKLVKSSLYPKCLLCIENVGYAGNIKHPARENHRVIPITMNNQDWAYQYSPYVYYNEHCIVFRQAHEPMAINSSTFVKLFDFVKTFPHYFLGSNADLPIVGGSILSHDHFQGGHYAFPMEKAGIRDRVEINGYEDIEAGIVKWPMSVIRLRHIDTKRIVECATHILNSWKGYSDEKCEILAHSDNEPHNTITPIARYKNGKYELDLVLRNNRTTKERPMGLFHPRSKYHNIKKENIGLIEVMGLAVLPSRLKVEMEKISESILNGKNIAERDDIKIHSEWVKSFINKYDNISKDNMEEILQKEIGQIFVKVLEDAGVYKNDKNGIEGFFRFVNQL